MRLSGSNRALVQKYRRPGFSSRSVGTAGPEAGSGKESGFAMAEVFVPGQSSAIANADLEAGQTTASKQGKSRRRASMTWNGWR